MFVWDIATRLPTVMVTAAMTANVHCMLSARFVLARMNSTMKILNSATNPIFLDPVARKPETGVAAPS